MEIQPPEMNDESVLDFIKQKKYAQFKDLHNHFNKQDQALVRILKRLIREKFIVKKKYNSFKNVLTYIRHKKATIYCTTEQGIYLEILKKIIKGLRSNDLAENHVCIQRLTRERENFKELPNLFTELISVLKRAQIENKLEIIPDIILLLHIYVLSLNLIPSNKRLNNSLYELYFKHGSIFSDTVKNQIISILSWLWDYKIFDLLKKDVLESTPKLKGLKQIYNNTTIGGILKQMDSKVLGFELELRKKDRIKSHNFNELLTLLHNNWYFGKQHLPQRLKELARIE